MALSIVRPAPLLALSDMLARDVLPVGLSRYAVARAQPEMGKSWGFVDETGKVLACAGLIATGDLEYEAWFSCLRELAPRFAEFVSFAQLTLGLAAHDATVTARVDEGHRPGEILARRLGFVRDPERPVLWKWRKR